MFIVSRGLLWNHHGNDSFYLFWRMSSGALWNHYRSNFFIMLWALSSGTLREHGWSIHIRVFGVVSRGSVRNHDRFDSLYCVCCGTLRRECGYDRFGLYGTLRRRNLVGWRSIGV